MTTLSAAAIERIKSLEQEIEAARSRGDLVAVARLRFEIPLEERNEWDATRGHLYATAQGRGYRGTAAFVTGGSAGTASPGGDWPSKVTMFHSLHTTLRNIGWDGREEGGWLTGYTTPNSTSEREILEIHRGSDEGESHRTRTTLRIDRAVSILESLPLDEAVIGDWHLHPPDESTAPSTQDLQAWSGLAESFKRSEWLGLIVAERQDSAGRFGGVDISAHLVRPQGTSFTHRSLDISTWSY